MIAILIFGGLAAVAILSLAPFVLPWNQRLRWLIAASTVPDPWGLGSGPWPGLEEMTVKAVVTCRGGRLIVGLGPSRTLWLDCATSQDVVNLEWSAATATPLLLVGATDGGVTLHGPSWAVSGLQTVRGQGRPGGPGPESLGLVSSGL